MNFTKALTLCGVLAVSCSSCSASNNLDRLDVIVSKVQDDPSPVVKVSFINNMGTDYWLSVYNFCKGGMIYQSLFEVSEVNNRANIASYGGLVDFVGPGSTTPAQFIKISPKSSVECVVNLRQFYLTRNGGLYVVKYVSTNPSFKDQKLMVLTSNEELVTLPSKK